MLDASDVAVLRCVYATVTPQAAPQSGSDQMAQALERLPQARVRKLRSLLQAMRSPALGLLLVGRSVDFTALPQAVRERYLRAMRDSSLAQLRTGYSALVHLALFLGYTGDDGERNALWSAIAYPGPRDDVPVRSLPAHPHVVPDRVDAIVVGSGAGGGIAAAVLAVAGMRVLVLEAGPWPDDVAGRQRERDAFASLYLESGLCGSEDLGVSVLAGACVGGGTTVNWTTSLRLNDDVARSWERASGGVDFLGGLAEHYDLVERRLGVVPTLHHNGNNAAVARGAAALGWRWRAQPRNAVGCGDGCGYCGFGCAYDRKQSTENTYLHDVVSNDGIVAADAPVTEIVIEGGRAIGVRANIGGVERTIRANVGVVCAAGSLRTPLLLTRSGIASAHLGRHLHLHPTTAVVAEFDRPIDAWNGPMQSALCDEFAAMDGAYGATIEAAPVHPGLAALALPWNGREDHATRMERLRRCAALIVLVRDRGEGSVSGPDATIRYRLASYDARHMRTGIEKTARLALAAGAQRAQSLHARAIEVEGPPDERSLQAFAHAVRRASTAPNRLGVFSAHQMGTARMHARRESGAVNADGRVHGVRNLIVADASVFPEASGVNPMLTIMALAHRSARQMLH